MRDQGIEWNVLLGAGAHVADDDAVFDEFFLTENDRKGHVVGFRLPQLLA